MSVSVEGLSVLIVASYLFHPVWSHADKSERPCQSCIRRGYVSPPYHPNHTFKAAHPQNCKTLLQCAYACVCACRVMWHMRMEHYCVGNWVEVRNHVQAFVHHINQAFPIFQCATLKIIGWPGYEAI